jgi:hypothetical protein
MCFYLYVLFLAGCDQRIFNVHGDVVPGIVPYEWCPCTPGEFCPPDRFGEPIQEPYTCEFNNNDNNTRFDTRCISSIYEDSKRSEMSFLPNTETTNNSYAACGRKDNTRHNE